MRWREGETKVKKVEGNIDGQRESKSKEKRERGMRIREGWRIGWRNWEGERGMDRCWGDWGKEREREGRGGKIRGEEERDGERNTKYPKRLIGNEMEETSTKWLSSEDTVEYN